MTKRRKILVTGANGFLGKHVSKYLISRCWPVFTGTRDGSWTLEGACGSISYGALEEKPELVALTEIDVIVHCAGIAHVLKAEHTPTIETFRTVNRDATIHLAQEAAKAGVKRFIFISTIGVNGDRTVGRAFRASDAPCPHSPYAISKMEGERELLALALETGMEVIIIRPPLIIGPDPVGNLATIAGLIKRGIPLPFGSVNKNRRTLASVDTISSLIETCLVNEGAKNQTFLVGDSRPRSTFEIIKLLGEYIGRKPVLIPFPVGVLRLILIAIGKRKMALQLFENLEVDTSETFEATGWRPPI